MMLVLILFTIAKLVLAAILGGTADIQQTFVQAQAFLSNKDVFDPSATGGNPSFFPIGHFVLGSVSLWASKISGLSFAFFLKIPAILADLVIAIVLRFMPRKGNRIALLYMLNPVTLVLSTYHGQLHTVAVAGAVLSLWFASQGRFWFGGLVLGLAASVRQHFAVFIIPIAKKLGKNGMALIMVFSAFFALVNAPLLNSHSSGHILRPTWTYGSWGYSMILLQGPRVLSLLGIGGLIPEAEQLNNILRIHGSQIYWVWAIVFSIWVCRHRDVDLWSAALLFILGLYVVSPGFGVQWLVWVVPFWLVINQREAIVYSLIAGAFLLGSYWQWGLNAKYSVRSLTANLALVNKGDLIGVISVGALGFLIWIYAARTACRLMRT